MLKSLEFSNESKLWVNYDIRSQVMKSVNKQLRGKVINYMRHDLSQPKRKQSATIYQKIKLMGKNQVYEQPMMEDLDEFRAAYDKNRKQSFYQKRMDKCLERIENLKKLKKDIDSPKLGSEIPDIYKQFMDKSLDANVYCQLSNDQVYSQTIDDAHLQQFSLLDQLEEQEKQFEKKKLQFAGNSKSRQRRYETIQREQLSKQDLQKFAREYQEKQLKLKESIIGTIETKKFNTFYSSDMRAKSLERQSRIQKANEKINKYKIHLVNGFLENDIHQKIEENNKVLEFINHYNIENVPPNLKDIILKNVSKPKDDKLIYRKLFFKYSNKNSEENQYKFLYFESLIECLNDLEVCIAQRILKLIYEKALGRQIDSVFRIQINGFLDIILEVAYICYENSPLNLKKRYDQFKFSTLEMSEEKTFKRKQKCLDLFYQNKIEPKITLILEQFDIQLRDCNQLEEFYSKIKPLTVEMFKKAIKDQSQYVNFDEIKDLFMNIELFPNKISKQDLKHYFYYCQNQDDGMLVDEFQDFMCIIGLYLQKKIVTIPKFQGVVNYYMFYFKETDDHTQKVFRKILIFYMNCINHDYITNIL